MAIATLCFYVFAAILVACGAMVITARNPVHSVLFLILAFFNAAGLFVLIGAEFLAMILVVVYVGAVAVLFLFVVMMLDINFRDMRKGAKRYAGVGAAIGIVLLAEILLVVGTWQLDPGLSGAGAAPTPAIADMHNTRALGNLIYTEYVYLFQGAGMVLLVAMMGAIVLTLRQREGVKRQRIADQVARSSKDEVRKVNVSSGSGI
ncbi:NADH-quinone oxidoreductase subunit J [Marivibrio halodurans]|uniref:NADH-quinone oxidoreductase subunit J n=1 Tax=Marivibrio halodurans TaxID=2039722 RepID=A0A8J7RVM4_9PROT|nr:NADH-quinone oxidoreductase subunit J [Marivibrio halodurans]MBP5855527.1 NADH-quinone oxidoreductase subunit J [Marivibrio halodurans]